MAAGLPGDIPIKRQVLSTETAPGQYDIVDGDDSIVNRAARRDYGQVSPRKALAMGGIRASTRGWKRPEGL